MIIQDSRIQLKYSTISGSVPTIPLTYDHTDGTWLPTDIYIGEIFFNVADNLAWWRSENGLVPFGATGSGGPFIGDFVSATLGGTYGGPVDGPEFTATLISGSTVAGVSGSFTGPVSASAFYGDGSNLTGITATWNGGTVANASTFQDDVTFNQDIVTDSIVANTGTINVSGSVVSNTGSIWNGAVTAVTYYGDGSNLTGIPGGTDYYTISASLAGNTIQFDRNDLVNAYSVDLSSIVGAPVSSMSWNNVTNALDLSLADGTTFTLTIEDFKDITVQGAVTADYFVGNGSLLTDLPVPTLDQVVQEGALATTLMEYDANYSASYTDRSIVDKAYVDSVAGGGGGGSGTVTSVSVVSANGLAGTVANATTTPAITLSTSVTGLLKGNGTAISAATSGTDYQAPISLTNIGTSGAATFISNTLNIPEYSQTLEETLVLGDTSGPNNIRMQTGQRVSHYFLDLGLRFDTDPGNADMKLAYIKGDSNGGYAQVGVDNTVDEDWAVARMQTRKSDGTGADIFLTQDDHNITLSTNDITGANSLFDILPGQLISNYTDGSGNYTYLNQSTYENLLGATIPAVGSSDALNTNSRNWSNAAQCGSGVNAFNTTQNLSATIEAQYDGSHIQNILVASDGVDTTQIIQRHFEVTVSGDAGSFRGIEYLTDYSANFTARSLVDKQYVDNAVVGGFIPPISPMEVFRGRTFRYDTTTVDTYGGIATLNNASAIAVEPNSTNFGNKFTRLRYYTTTVATGRVTSIRSTELQWYIHGGFRFVSTWRVADTAYGATCQNFHGLIGTTSEIAVGGAGLIQVSTLTNCIFVGNDGADANLQVMHNDATGTCTKIDLGANFPANRTAGAAMTTMYAVEIYNGVRETEVKYRVTNLETGAIAEGTITTNLPATTQGLAIQSARVMGTPITNTGQWEQHKWGCSDITA